MKRSIFINPDFVGNAALAALAGIRLVAPSVHINPSFLQRPAIHLNPLYLKRQSAKMQVQQSSNVESTPRSAESHIPPKLYCTKQATAAPPLASKNANIADQMHARALLRPITKITPKSPRSKVEKPKKTPPRIRFAPPCRPVKKNVKISPVTQALQPKLAPTPSPPSRPAQKNLKTSPVTHVLQPKSDTTPTTPCRPAKKNINISPVTHVLQPKLATNPPPRFRPAKKNGKISPATLVHQPKLASVIACKRASTFTRLTPLKAWRQKRFQTTRHAQMKNVGKSPVPCPIFRRTGKCDSHGKGKCKKLHDKSLVAICKKFLRGDCRNAKCLLSHDISLSKMPVCKFFLQACCGRDNCPYLHKKLSDKAPLCMDFLRGYCERAGKCDKRHEFLCPEFESTGVCHTKKCQYCGTKKFQENRKLEKEARQIAKFKKRKRARIEKEEQKEEEPPVRRYYDKSPPDYVGGDPEATAVEESEDIILIPKKRMKIGEQPAFIPF